MRKYNKQIVAGISVAVMFLSIIPLLMLAQYAKPVADDFGYGGPIYYAIKNGSGFGGALKALIENIRYTYLNWQGTFTSVFFFSIQPAVFFEDLYALTPYIMISVIVASLYILASSIYQAETWGKIFIGSIVSLVALQFLPSVAEGIYWWNGAAHYIVCWFLLTVAITNQINIQRLEPRKKSFYFYVIYTCLLVFLVGGGNYSTALVCTVVSFAITLYTFLVKKSQKVILSNALITFISILGLIISMIAPGNAVRQADFEKMSIIPAVLTSFSEAIKSIVNYTDLIIVCALLLCIPVFLMSIRKREASFPYPLAVVVGTFCIFASMYTPPLYAMGFSDVPRMNNMFYLAYLTFIFGNSFYIAGWISRKYPKFTNRYILKGLAFIGAIMFLVSFAFQIKTSNAYLAFSDLKSEALQTYTKERDLRTLTHEDKSASPRFTPISEYPICFVPAKHLTWSPDLFVGNTPANLTIYRSCGGEVTFVGFEDALTFFECSENLSINDFSKNFYIDNKTCVPLREVVNELGLDISYDALCDTIYITSVK